jgi:hypothetical protein
MGTATPGAGVVHHIKFGAVVNNGHPCRRIFAQGNVAELLMLRNSSAWGTGDERLPFLLSGW